MKVKNLLLAGLAVAAMTACSNDVDEIVNNGNQTGEKSAIMEFGIAFPALTRTVDAGLATEQEFQVATVIIDYGNNKDIRKIDRIDFDTKETGANSTILYTKKAITVTPGKAVVSVILNSTSTITDALNGTGWNDITYTANYGENTLAGITDITKDNEFLMSGEAKEAVEFTEGDTKEVKVSVNRVAAKLEERTPINKEFTVEISNGGKDIKPASGKTPEVKVSVSEYSYANLQKVSKVFENSDTEITANLFQPYNSKLFFTSITGVKENTYGDITYCLENKTDENTMAIYKAIATIDGEAITFWVDNDGTLYRTGEEVNKKYSQITESTSTEDCWKSGVRKYTDGICYYKATIMTNTNQAEIVRNNVYKLTVTGIAKLGLPEPKDDPEIASLDLEVSVEPWTIQVNDFELK